VEEEEEGEEEEEEEAIKEFSPIKQCSNVLHTATSATASHSLLLHDLGLLLVRRV
jgi:hypothetical protein